MRLVKLNKKEIEFAKEMSLNDEKYIKEKERLLKLKVFIREVSKIEKKIGLYDHELLRNHYDCRNIIMHPYYDYIEEFISYYEDIEDMKKSAKIFIDYFY